MNKQIFLIGWIWMGFTITALAQKPVVDSAAFNNWPRVGQANISGDGNYIVYEDILASKGGEPTIVLQAMREKWKKPFKGIKSYHMVQDGRQLVLQKTGDSLFILEPATKKMHFLSRVSSYQVIGKGDKEWLCYESIADVRGARKLTLYSPGKNKQLVEDSVTDHWFNEQGDVMIVKKKMKNGTPASYTWEWHNLENGVVGKIWDGDIMSGRTLDQTGRKLVFSTPVQGSARFELRYYQEGMVEAEPRPVNGSDGIDSSLRLDNYVLRLSRDGKQLFFSLRPSKDVRPSRSGVQVDVWSYRDRLLEEAQVNAVNDYVSYLGWMNVETGKARLLEKNGIHMYALEFERHLDKVLLRKEIGGDDTWWRGQSRDTVWLATLHDNDENQGAGYELTKAWTNSVAFTLSPQDKYVVYYDPVTSDYQTYEMEGGQTHNFTKEVRAAEGSIKDGELYNAGWIPWDEAILFYDKWDIWGVDPKGGHPPINLTKGYGRLHHIRLRLADEERSNDTWDISPNKDLLLTAFDTATKYSGYYRLRLDKGESPQPMTMGPYRYFSAKQASNAWLVLRESAEEAPNYYYTLDWVHFLQVTDVSPQKKYNWLKADLVTWPLPDGELCQGMLFKPESLDTHKKYPLLIHYYQAPSDELYEFRNPAAFWDDINIPYFASRGYVVFVPDIHYRFGYAGESALASIVSGARYLSRQPWIDSTRMGLQGHSFGGYETNYIITHSNLFAAAQEGAGVSDMISDCNTIIGSGSSNQGIFEAGQYRVGVSLWENPEVYIKGSPIFNADKVTTPLLIMHNKHDEAVPWQQGVEFFSALRRCGKKVWMLQYDQGKHSVQPGPDAMDFTIRVEQFFNYYLKGAPPPKWMTEGIPALRKGWETGYELDTSGKQP